MVAPDWAISCAAAVSKTVTAYRALTVTETLEPSSFSPFEKVASITPSSLLIKLERVKRREIPIQLELRGEPPEGFRLKKVELRPQTARFRGAESRIDAVEKINTLPVDLSEVTERNVAEGIHHSRAWHACFDAIQFGPVPVISVLHGAVVGGGLLFAQYADLVVASETAKFLYPEAKVGFSGGLIASLAARIPHKDIQPDIPCHAGSRLRHSGHRPS